MPTMTELLPPCKTSTHRTLKWTPSATPSLECDGIAEVWDFPKGQPRRRCYRVLELVPGRGFAGKDCRCFRLTKDDGERYDVRLERHAHSCDCKAGCYGKVEACCHVLAIRAILENGWLPDPRERPREAEPLPNLDEINIALAPTCPRCCEGRLFEDSDGYCRCDRCGYAS